jgi:hypothetical protein
MLLLHDHDGTIKVEVSVTSSGHGYVSLDRQMKLIGSGNDYAEVFDFATRANVLPGTVMSVADDVGKLAPSSAPYDGKVVGVVSGAGNLSPGVQLGGRSDGSTDFPIAVVGQVYVRVCLENGPIHPGDLLVASSAPGVAMRSTDPARAFGAVIGKALGSYTGAGDESGKPEGLVRMLVMSR